MHGSIERSRPGTGKPGLRRFLLTGAILPLLALSACSSVKGMFGAGNDDTVLPGKREAVVPNTGALAPDPTAASTPIVIPAAQTNANWAQPGGVPTNAYQNLSLGANLSTVWSASIGEGSDRDGQLSAPPIVVGGRVYTLDIRATLSAFDASSGARAWSTSLVPQGRSSQGAFGGGIASDGRRLFVTTGLGEVLAVDASNGAIIWRKSVTVPVRAAPTVVNGRVFIVNVNNQVFAFSTENGAELWRFEGAGEQAAVISNTSPAVASDTVVAPYTSGELIAFRESDGIPKWGDALTTLAGLSSTATLNNIGGRPVIEGNQVIAISHAGRLGAFSLSDGVRQWTQDISGTQTPWIAGDTVFVISNRNILVALSRKNGAVRWSSVLPSGQRWAGPVMGGGRLIAVSSTGTVATINPQDGQIINQMNLERPFFIPPIIANNTLYLLANDGTLIALR
ncbi:PQQ-binding-like beta-propeller repeat protein [Rhodoligotrophos defluvii]|uniref:outer membrane protein assembly factor BamB family protein n=1 Tax=Rhodoligotrophos defluvii TaxID=2561934 RepID=UPI0014853DC2|nr:PQQ-binding-like beta-propeller repeat protein [Rhodoligotrophos defluvii]